MWRIPFVISSGCVVVAVVESSAYSHLLRLSGVKVVIISYDLIPRMNAEQFKRTPIGGLLCTFGICRLDKLFGPSRPGTNMVP